MNFSSDTLLLSTKLKIPAPRKNYVVRRALFHKLSLCGDMGVIFVNGGAGTGKTTLLSSFIRETKLKNVSWMSVDAANANVYSFWLYFTAAVSTFWEDGDSFLTLVRSSPDTSHLEKLLIMIINRLCGEEDYYMVLDDVHCIKDAALVKTFEFFLRSMPSNFHFFMLSREDPPVYLGPLAVSGRLLFIDGKQMQLSPEEGLTFLKNTLELQGSDEELEEINAYAEGWIGGLQLAAAAGSGGRYSRLLLGAGGGIAAEYLTREVFESLAQKERDFLTGTGFLSYFDAGICKSLFDDFSGNDFDQMMERLIQKNLFVVCMDEGAGIYRYHNILSEYLKQQFSHLPEEHRKALHIKAAGAFKQRGDWEESLKEYCEAEDFDNVIRTAHEMDGRIEAWGYLNKVPVHRLIADADLAAQCFMYNIGNMNMERCRILFEEFRECYGDSDIFHIIQFAEAYVSHGDGILPRYHSLTAEQIKHLHLGPVAKSMVLIQNSAALIEQMRYTEAESCIERAIQTCSGANVFVDFFAYNQLAQIYEETGRLNDSLSCYAKSGEMIQSPSLMMGVGTNFYFGIAGVYMRRMELDKAEEMLEQARRIMNEQRIRVDVTDLTLAYHEAELRFLHGEDDAGARCVDEIMAEYPLFNIITLSRLIHELDCGGKLTDYLTQRFLEELNSADHYKSQPFMMLLHARLIFKRGELEEAIGEIDEILAFSRLHKNKLRLVEADLLKILVLLHCGEKEQKQREIHNLFREAVHYAHKDRISMPFYLDRFALQPLLEEYSQNTSGDSLSAAEEAFIKQTAALCGLSKSASRNQDLLSARELEVLKEMSLGITNREIAERLCISQATVKTHILSIFGKLDVSARMMAVHEGRKKGLI